MRLRRSASLLVSSWILAAAAGCERPGPPIAHTAASAVSPVAAEAEPVDAGGQNALMRLAFPGWKPEDWRVLHVPRRDDARAITTIRVQPRMVVAIDEAHRALGDIVIAYTARRVVERAADQPRTFETAENTVVYRYSNAGYTKLSGDEPK